MSSGSALNLDQFKNLSLGKQFIYVFAIEAFYTLLVFSLSLLGVSLRKHMCVLMSWPVSVVRGLNITPNIFFESTGQTVLDRNDAGMALFRNSAKNLIPMKNLVAMAIKLTRIKNL